MNHKVVLVVYRNLYQSNSLKLLDYVEKYVEIVTFEGEKVYGTVYTIDPVSESVVLTINNGITSMKIVMGHAIISITSGGEVYMECKELFLCSLSRFGKESRKEKLKNWLIKNRIPIEEKAEVLPIKDILEVYLLYSVERAQVEKSSASYPEHARCSN